jgi:hypothetical protein
MTKRVTAHDHKCARPGCRATVRPSLLACFKDWWKLPADIRGAIGKHYVTGQTLATAKPEYHAALKRALEFWKMLDESNKAQLKAALSPPGFLK